MESTSNAGDPGLGRSLGEGNSSTPVFLPGEFHGLYSPWGCKESDKTVTFTLALKIFFCGQVNASFTRQLSLAY